MDPLMGPRRILVVDDEPVTLKLASRALRAAGFEVQTLDTGFGFAVQIRKFKPDLVLMDVEMPGLRGDHALSAAWQLLPEAQRPPVVLYSGARAEVLEALCVSVGAAGYIRKPSRPSEFIRTVKGFLPRPAPGRGAALGS